MSCAAEMRDEAARRLRNTLVIQEIARRENVNVTAEDIQQEIENVAGASEQGEAIRNLYQQPQFLNMLRGDLFERRLTDRLIDIVTEGKGATINGWQPPVATESDEMASDEMAAPDSDETDATTADQDADAMADTADAAASGEADADETASAENDSDGKPAKRTSRKKPAADADGDRNPEAEEVGAKIVSTDS